VNLLTSQAALDSFISRFNTSTYSMNSAHKPRKIAVPLKKCKIDFATTSVVKLKASAAGVLAAAAADRGACPRSWRWSTARRS